MIFRRLPFFLILNCAALAALPAYAQYSGEDADHVLDDDFIIILDPTVPTIPTNPDGTGNDGDLPDGARMIHWTHGFMGDEFSWSRALDYVSDNAGTEDQLAGRDWGLIIENNSIGYPDAAGIDVSASELKGEIAVAAGALDDINHANSFVIAHSFGGLATRQVYEEWVEGGVPTSSREFGGLVTFGTPHLGAGLAENRFDIDEFIVEGCLAVSEAWLVETIGNQVDGIPLPLNGFVVPASEAVSSALCNGAVGPFINVVTAPITGSQAAVDLTPGSDALDDLNGDGPEPDLYKQAMYGLEDQDDLFWRMSAQFLSTAAVNNAAGAVFPAPDDDQEFLDEVANYQAEFRRLGDKWADRREDQWDPICLDWYGGNILSPYTCDDMEALRDAFYDGANWLDRADFGYKELGEFVEERERYVVTSEMCVVDGSWTDLSITNATGCYSKYGNRGDWQEQGYTVIEYEPVPNDGVVTQQSATAFGSDHFRMEGSNHFQMRNDRNTKEALDLLLAGRLNEWFDSQ